MKSKHPKEDQVAKLMNFKAKAQRKEINEGFKRLRLEGDMAANKESLMSGTGYAVVIRNSDLENYIHPVLNAMGFLKVEFLMCWSGWRGNFNLRTSQMLLVH